MEEDVIEAAAEAEAKGEVEGKICLKVKTKRRNLLINRYFNVTIVRNMGILCMNAEVTRKSEMIEPMCPSPLRHWPRHPLS